MSKPILDRELYVLGDASDHVGFLNCERISDRSHIHAWSVEEHFHEGLAQLFLFSSGRVSSKIEGLPRQLVGPAAAWLPSLASHAFDYDQDMDGWVITVPTSDIARMVIGAPWLKGWSDRPQTVENHQSPAILTRLADLVQMIEEEHGLPGPERNQVLEALLLLALATLRRASDGNRPNSDYAGRKAKLIDRFMVLLDERCAEGLSVAEYARLLSVTPTHLSRSAKHVTGRTAGKIVRDRALLQAKRKLAFSDQTITEIAYTLGFSSPSYFTRFFASHTGKSPKEFRRHVRQDRGAGKTS